MIEKAILIAKEALQYIVGFYPADDPKFISTIGSISTTQSYLTRLYESLLDIEHTQKSAINNPCTCRRCSAEARNAEEEKKVALSVALKEELEVPTEST